MSAPVPTTVPGEIPAGTTIKFSRSFSAYPAGEGWSYSIHLAGPGILTKAAASSGDLFLVTITATDSAALPPGNYRYVERATKDGETYQVGIGQIMVTPDLAQATAGSALTMAEKNLAAIDAVLQNRITKDVESYSIAGRSVVKIPLAELTRLRGVWAGIVYQQRNPGTLGPSVNVQFGGGQ